MKKVALTIMRLLVAGFLDPLAGMFVWNWFVIKIGAPPMPYWAAFGIDQFVSMVIILPMMTGTVLGIVPKRIRDTDRNNKHDATLYTPKERNDLFWTLRFVLWTNVVLCAIIHALFVH